MLYFGLYLCSFYLMSFNLSSRYLNDAEYIGGFEQEDLNQLFEAMRQNYRSWCGGFAPLMIGGDIDSLVMQEFCRTLFSMRPDIALNLVNTIFHSDLRPVLGLVSVPCHIIQCNNDLAVPMVVSDYLHQNLGGCSVVEVMVSDGHLPHISSPGTSIPVLLRHIRLDITS